MYLFPHLIQNRQDERSEERGDVAYAIPLHYRRFERRETGCGEWHTQQIEINDETFCIFWSYSVIAASGTSPLDRDR